MMGNTKQFSKYSGVAVGSAVTDYTVFSIFLFLGIGTLPAQMSARFAGGVFAFFMNKYWSFGATGKGVLKREGRRFLVLYAFSYVLALAIVFLLTKHVGLSAYPAKISADITCFMINFIVMQNYVFGGGGGLSGGLRRLFGSEGKAS